MTVALNVTDLPPGGPAVAVKSMFTCGLAGAAVVAADAVVRAAVVGTVLALDVPVVFVLEAEVATVVRTARALVPELQPATRIPMMAMAGNVQTPRDRACMAPDLRERSHI